MLKVHHNAMIFNDASLLDIFPSPPMPAYRQPPNLRKILCRAELQQPTIRNLRKPNAGWKKCGKNCIICPISFEPITELKALNTNYVHKFTEPVSCNTSNCIYYWRCTKRGCKFFPKCEYVGQSKNEFKQRYYGHRYDVTHTVPNKARGPAGLHFNLPGHSISDMRGLV